MSNIKKSMANGLFATAAVAVIALVAAWQFYLFATFKNAQGIADPNGGGTYHLWLAIAAALVACVAGFIVFSISVGYDKDDEMHITS
jgi:hypothetical protein